MSRLNVVEQWVLHVRVCIYCDGKKKSCRDGQALKDAYDGLLSVLSERPPASETKPPRKVLIGESGIETKRGDVK
jgi:hypothetical protein